MSDTITTTDAAKLLGRSRSHVIYLIRHGKIPYQRFGRDYVLSRSAIASVHLPGKGWRRKNPA